MLRVLLITIILSMIPISELRGGIIYAVSNGISPFNAFFISVIANILAVFLIFFFLDFLHERFMKINIYRKTFDFYMERVRKKADELERKIGVYGFLALMLFVAVPLPATGAWTGVLIAWILGLDRKKSILAVCFGVIIAGIIVLLASLGVINLINLFFNQKV